MTNNYFKRDFRTKLYSKGEKILPSERRINIVKKIYEHSDRKTNPEMKRAFTIIFRELEALAQKQYGVMEVFINKEFRYIHVKIAASYLMPLDIYNIIHTANPHYRDYAVSIEPIDCKTVCLNMIFENIEI